MNSSNGFGNGSLLGSSTGFKKRPLLRPPSGLLSKKQQYLKSIDISQAQPTIGATLRAQVAAMDQQINLLDKDKRLRQGDSSLQKNWIVSLRKWLREVQGLNQKQEDEVKILKQLGTQNIEAGFKKLWKIVCHLDLVITKHTELQIIHLLLYDQMFDSIGKDTNKSINILNQIGNQGYCPGTFQVSQILLERSKDIYASSKKVGNGKRQQTSQIINDLKRQNSKLTQLLQRLNLQKQNDRKKQKQKYKQRQKQKQNVIGSSTSISSSKDILKDIQQKYQEQLKVITLQRNKCQQNLIQVKVQLSSLQSQIKALTETQKIQRPPVASGSYQQALMQQMQKMKKGFQKKIAILNDDFSNKQRQLRRKQVQLKSQNDKIKWEKSLLLKKYQILSK